jgi:hypothetical protein
MALTYSSPEDVLNDCLVRIGYKRRIGSIWEGSEAAKMALSIYSQTRDDTLMGFDWGFAEGNVAAELLKSAPPGGYGGLPWSSAYPPLPFLYEYAYPADCLKVRAMKPTPVFVPNFDPKPYVWSVDNDNSLTPPAKAISCNVPNAIIVYTRQVTNPQEWESDFCDALSAALARRLAKGLADIDSEKLESADEQSSLGNARMMEG